MYPGTPHNCYRGAINLMFMDLLKITNDPSYPNDFMNESDNLNSSILIIKEIEDSKDTTLELNRSFSSSSSSSSLRKITTITTTNLDISRISDRLIVTSADFNNNNTEKDESINNQLNEFLKSKYRDKYLIWNLGPSECYLNPATFNFRLISCILPKSQSHTLKFLFHQCHAMLGWLQLSPDNVIVLRCADGWGRSSLLMSCLMKFSGAVGSTFEALNIFQSRRIKTAKHSHNFNSQNGINMRYLKYFNDICNSRGRVPNPSSLCLHQIIISTIPIFDNSASCSPGLEIFQNNELILSSACIGNNSQLSSDIYLFKDDLNIIFKVKDNSLSGDIQLHVFHSDQRTGQRTTIFSFTFNTVFSYPGVIRLRSEDLDIPLKDSIVPSLNYSDTSAMKSGQKRFKDEFCVDLILLPSDNENDNSLDYVSTVRNNEAKNLLRLSQMLPIRPNRKLLPPLLLPAFPKFYCKLALQLYANDLHDAHEFLAKLRDQNCGLNDLEKSFLELNKIEKEPIEEGSNSKITDTKTNSEVIDTDNTYTNSKTDDVKTNSKTDDTKTNSHIIDTKTNPHIIDTKTNSQIIDTKANSHINDNAIEEITGVIDTEINHDKSAKSQTDIQTDDHIENSTDSSESSPIKLSISAPLPSFSGIGIKNTSDNNANIPPPPPLPAPRTNSCLSFDLPNAPPPPPPLPPIMNINSVNRRHSCIEKPKIKNTLHWNELSISAEEVRQSIWHEIANNSFDAQLNTKRFEEMFCIGTPKLENGNNATINNVTSVSILPVIIDIRRANNVGIGLARFQKRFNSFGLLIEEVYLEKCSLDLDDLLTLKTIIPTEDEIMNLKLIKKSDKILIDRMGPAEQFMFQISNDKNQQANLSKAINYKIFESTCQQELEGLKQKFEMITKVLESLKSSEELKIILKATLDLGNLATYKYGRKHGRRNSAYGFTLDSLCKLHEVKSVDNQSNLLIFLTSSLAQSHPEALKLVELKDFKDLESIKGWSDKQLTCELDLLQGMTEGILNDIEDLTGNDLYSQFWSNAKLVAEKFKNDLANFKSTNLQNFHQTWHHTRIYFGHSEEVESVVFGDVSTFLITIWQFFKNFEVAIKQVTKQQQNNTIKNK